jgi:hypothetical protein
MCYLTNKRWALVGVLVLVLLTALAVGLSQAQEPEPPGSTAHLALEAYEAAADVASWIPIQGRLTDAGGNPLTGSYTIRFGIYEVASGGSALCQETKSVEVVNGLFNSEVVCSPSTVNGRQLYLGIKVGADEEMTDRQAIYPVPYAFSLRPGARIYGEVGGAMILDVRNSSTVNGSAGVFGQAAGLSGVTYGIYGASLSADGYGGRFFGGNGLIADGVTGVAIKAGGTGIIQSTASSYLWISGNSLQKANSDDTTRWQYDDYGGYKVYGGSDWGSLKRVVLPVTIPGQLYGQNVTVTGLDLYHARQGEFARIDAVIVRRQDGVGTGNLVLYDDTDLLCSPGSQCSTHWNLTQNNVLSDQRGILHIVLRFAYGGESDYLQIGGVRLTLEHD